MNRPIYSTCVSLCVCICLSQCHIPSMSTSLNVCAEYLVATWKDKVNWKADGTRWVYLAPRTFSLALQATCTCNFVFHFLFLSFPCVFFLYLFFSCFLVFFLFLLLLFYFSLPYSSASLLFPVSTSGIKVFIGRDNSVFSVPAICFHSHKIPGEHITETLADSVSNVKLCGGRSQIFSVKYMYSTCVTVCLHYSTYSIILHTYNYNNLVHITWPPANQTARNVSPDIALNHVKHTLPCVKFLNARQSSDSQAQEREKHALNTKTFRSHVTRDYMVFNTLGQDQ